MSRELTGAVLAADGGPGDGTGPRVFCIIEEINAQVCARDTAGRGFTVDGRLMSADLNR